MIPVLSKVSQEKIHVSTHTGESCGPTKNYSPDKGGLSSRVTWLYTFTLDCFTLYAHSHILCGEIAQGGLVLASIFLFSM